MTTYHNSQLDNATLLEVSRLQRIRYFPFVLISCPLTFVVANNRISFPKRIRDMKVRIRTRISNLCTIYCSGCKKESCNWQNTLVSWRNRKITKRKALQNIYGMLGTGGKKPRNNIAGTLRHSTKHDVLKIPRNEKWRHYDVITMTPYYYRYRLLIAGIDVFPIIFDARGLTPDMLWFPCVCAMTFTLGLWRHRINT